MQALAIPYIFRRGFYRMTSFFIHWYRGSFSTIARWTIGFLETLDRVFAVRVMAGHLFEPLYQDHTALGHLFGFLFRVTRLLFGGLLYLIIILGAGILYLVWIGLPTYAILEIVFGLFS